jgi:SOS-response transcriptional repressor LexA
MSMRQKTAKKFQIWSEQNGVSQLNFMDAVKDYLEKNGVNPLKHESAQAELQKMSKRVEQLVKYFTEQELKMVRPMYEAMMASDVRIRENMRNFATKEDIVHLQRDIYIIGNILAMVYPEAANETVTKIKARAAASKEAPKNLE